MADEHAVKTVQELMAEVATSIKDMLTTLIREHSTLYLWNTPSYAVNFFSLSGDYAWRELPLAGKQLQAKLLEEYRYFASIMRVLLAYLPEESVNRFEELDQALLATIKEDDHTHATTKEDALAKALQQVDEQMALLGHLYDYDDEDYIVVPDTNVLLANPDLETWTIPDSPTFTIYLTPTVLSELDSLKVNHRNEHVQRKAQGLIRRIREYHRRGRLTEGVTLRKGVSRVASVAIEPDFEKTLEWLRKDNADDRLLASFLEIMRRHPRTRCVLLTGDANLLNKADFARLPVGDPPEV